MDDLETIFDFIAEKSPLAAPKIIEKIINRAKQLESFPESGAIEIATKHKQMASRYLVEGNYKIIYDFHLRELSIFILTVFDSRFDPEKMRI